MNCNCKENMETSPLWRERVKENVNPISELDFIPSLAASAKQTIGHFRVGKMRTLTISCRATSNGAATSGVRVNVYYSPTGKNDEYDTVAFGFDNINLVTAGTTQQESHNYDVPEEGEVRIQIENLDSGQAATNIKTWLTFRRWLMV